MDSDSNYIRLPISLKYFAIKQQHLRQLQIYIEIPSKAIPLYKVSPKYVLIQDASQHQMPIFLYYFDCSVEAELAKIAEMPKGWVSITVPLEIESTDVPKAKLMAHDESSDFPTSYELALSSFTRGLYTRCCGAPLLRTSGADVANAREMIPYFPYSSPFNRSFVMPSPYWQELADIWFCHNRKAAVVSGERHDAEAKPSRLLTGESTLTVHSDDLSVPLTVLQAGVGSSNNMKGGNTAAPSASNPLYGSTVLHEHFDMSHGQLPAPRLSLLLTQYSMVPEGKPSFTLDSSQRRVRVVPETILTDAERTAVKQANLSGVLGSSVFVSPVPITSKFGAPEYEPTGKASPPSSTQSCSGHDHGDTAGTKSTCSTSSHHEASSQAKDLAAGGDSQERPTEAAENAQDTQAASASQTDSAISTHLEALRWRKALPLVCTSCSQHRTLGEAQVLIRPVKAVRQQDAPVSNPSQASVSVHEDYEIVVLGPVSLFKCMITNVPPPFLSQTFTSQPIEMPTSTESKQDQHNPIKPLKPLAPAYNVYTPYTLENLAASILLSAAHAHVSYRFLIIDPDETAAVQIVLTNWDCQIKTAGLPMMVGQDSLQIQADSQFALPDHRARSEGDMVPAVRLTYRSSILNPGVSTDNPETKVSGPGFSELPREVFGWGFVLGAQQITWTRDDIIALTQVLEHRSNILPQPLQFAGAAKGFRQSFLLRISKLASKQPNNS